MKWNVYTQEMRWFVEKEIIFLKFTIENDKTSMEMRKKGYFIFSTWYDEAGKWDNDYSSEI